MKALTRVLRYIKLSPGQGSSIFLGKCLISKTLNKKYVVSRSSTKAEYRALADFTYEITWLKCLLKDLNIPLSTPTTIYRDNASIIAFASNPIQQARTKHIELDCHFVRDKIREGSIYLPSSLQDFKLLMF
ncbi:uncharacterized mitochondrial protein-like protein [Tanacetum coccineum]